MITNERQRFKEYPTPRIEDVIFYKKVTSRNGNVIPPQTGTKLSGKDLKDFPDHRFSFAEMTRDGDYLFYYVADRIKQDDYNWSFVQADIGGNKFSAVRRNYVTRRKDYDPENLKMGTVMADPTNKFSDTYILGIREQAFDRDPKINNLYVVEQRTYIKRVTITRVTYDRLFGIPIYERRNLYYRGEIYDNVPNPAITIEDAVDNHLTTYFGRDTNQNGDITLLEQISENWYLEIITQGRDTAIDEYSLTYPIMARISLPNVLKSVDIEWNGSSGDGATNGLQLGNASGNTIQESMSVRGGSEASASLVPRLVVNMERGYSGRIKGEMKVFYCREADVATKIANLGTMWPIFKEESHSIVLKGGSASIRTQASASSSKVDNDSRTSTNSGWITSYGSRTSNNTATVNIPPSIHPAITFGGLNTKTESDTSWADASISSTIIPSVNSFISKNVSVDGVVSPSSLAATAVTEIPTSGIYILDIRVFPFEFGWVRVAVTYIDAADLV